MSPAAQRIFEEAAQLDEQERHDLMELLSRLDDQSEPEPLSDRDEVIVTLRERAKGPFIPMNTAEQRASFWQRVHAKARENA